MMPSFSVASCRNALSLSHYNGSHQLQLHLQAKQESPDNGGKSWWMHRKVQLLRPRVTIEAQNGGDMRERRQYLQILHPP